MSHTRIALKIKAYAAYHQQQRHVAKFGMNYFQVAIITSTRARAENLKAELHQGMSSGSSGPTASSRWRILRRKRC